MSHNKSFRTATFVLFTFTVIMSVVFMESMPNHRLGDGDYDMWLALTLFPIIFLLHGVLSGIVLEPAQKRIYFITTPLMFIIAFALCRVAFDGMDVFESIKIGVIGGACYTIISFVGRSVYLLVMKLLHSTFDKHHKTADHSSNHE